MYKKDWFYFKRVVLFNIQNKNCKNNNKTDIKNIDWILTDKY